MAAGTPKAQTLGPGSLTIGKTGEQLDLSCQLSECRVTVDVDEGDIIPVLCGGELVEDDVYTTKITGTVIQDLSAKGVIDYTWRNKGKVVPCTFTPTTGAARVAGDVKIRPIDIGGEVRKRNTSDFEWVFVGDAQFTPMAAS